MLDRRSLFVACYGASGAAALVYQVVWVRRLTLVFGHTVVSSSLVLAAFMCGLALGAWLAGRARLTPPRALAMYAGLELLVAGFAVVLPVMLSSVQPLLSWAYANGAAPVQFSLVRAAIGFVLLGIPAAAMGATFPVAVAWVVRRAGRTPPRASRPHASEAGLLYAANTAGAAAGALAAGFWLIPSYGLSGSTWVAVGLNVLAASGALWLRRTEVLENGSGIPFPRKQGKRIPGPLSTSGVRVSGPHSAMAGTAAAVSGFAALVFEVAWTRLIATIIGPTTYAFALMAASFIVGIAVGSAAGVRVARSGRHRATWLAASLIVTAAATLAASWFAAREVPMMVARYVSEAGAFGPLLLREAVLIGLLVTGASIASGATFTLALALSSPAGDSTERDTSNVYAANTIGAVFGSLTAGFLLLPALGLAATFAQTSRILLAAGTLLAALSLYRRTVRGAGAVLTACAGALLFAATFALPPWSHALLASGLYKYAREIDLQDLDVNVRAGRLEYYKEGAAGAVSVRTLGGTRSLAIDGKVDASNGGDMLTQRLLGLLPALIHPNPREALVIGLGSGVTADSIVAAGTIARMDVVEISPEVVEAAALFEHENRGILHKPGVRLLIGDGRTHLQLTSQQYDVIVSEPSNPWMAGVAALFTREFFESVRARLKPDGVFCQWAHTYEIDSADLQSIVRTFASVFPQGTLWLAGDGDLLLVGSAGPGIEHRIATMPERMLEGPAVELLADFGVPPRSAQFFLFSLYAGGPAELLSYGDSAPVQTDNLMSLEFTAPRAMYAPPQGNAQALRALAQHAVKPEAIAATLRAATASDWVVRGEAGLKVEAFGMAHESFRRAAALDGANYEAVRGAVTAAAATGRLPEETTWLRARSAEDPQNPAVRTALSYALALAGDIEGAIGSALDAGRLAPDSPQPLEQLASVLADAGDPQLASVASTLVAKFPDRKDSRYYEATALVLQNRPYQADAVLTEFLQTHPRHAKAQNLRGVICAQRRDFSCATAAFEAASTLDPHDSTAYVNLGNVYLQQADFAKAERAFAEALAMDPGAAAARTALQTMPRK